MTQTIQSAAIIGTGVIGASWATAFLAHGMDVDDDVIAFGNNRSGLISERRWRAPDQIEQAVASGLDVRAVLDVVRRPVALRRLVVAFVEQRIERFEHQDLVRLLVGFRHFAHSHLYSDHVFDHALEPIQRWPKSG